jgi:hypothetical protein
MTKQEFRNLICLLHSVDSWELPASWSTEMQSAFLRDSVDFFLRCDDERSDAIWNAMMSRFVKYTPPSTVVDDSPF